MSLPQFKPGDIIPDQLWSEVLTKSEEIGQAVVSVLNDIDYFYYFSEQDLFLMKTVAEPSFEPILKVLRMSSRDEVMNYIEKIKIRKT